jgi:hypothetical protein
MLTENITPRPKKERRPADRRPRPATPTQRLLTVKQVTEEFGLPRRTVCDLYLTAKLPAVRFVDGGRLWFRREDVEHLIASSVERHA